MSTVTNIKRYIQLIIINYKAGDIQSLQKIYNIVCIFYLISPLSKAWRDYNDVGILKNTR